MPALLLLALRFLGTTAIFVAAEKIFESIIDKDEDTALDEILGGVAGAAFFGASNLLKVKKGIQNIPLATNVTTPKAAAEFLEAIVNNKKGAAAINAKLGGFGPLAIKLAKGAAAILTKKGLLLTAGAVLIYKFVSWLIWAPQLGQQFLDQGVFAPEQANEIMDSWGIPDKFRWTISETRKIDTELERLKLDKKLAELSAGIAGIGSIPKTIIRMVTEKKPEQFIGTLFSAKLGDMKSFNRVIDDEITSREDLEEDIKLNLNAWLTSLPGRMGYSVVIRKDPVDSQGVKQSGIWATLTLHFTRLSGPIQPIDTILLGPISPATRLVLTKEIKTIESQIPGMLSGQKVIQVEVPGGSFDIFDTAGERVDLSTPRIAIAPPISSETQTTTPTTQPDLAPGVTQATTPAPTPIAIPTVLGTPETLVPTTPAPTPAPDIPQEVLAVNWGSTPVLGLNNIVCAQVCGVPIQNSALLQHQVIKVATNGVGLNLRASPGLSGSILETIPDNILMRVNNSRGVVDGSNWLDVSIPVQPGRIFPRSGFMAAEFLSPA